MPTDEPVPHIPGYKIVRFIGKGANATVYLAMQESLNRYVALKVLEKFERPAQAVRFFNEGQIVASMNHSNIITIYDIGTAGSQQYIAMEYLDDGSLRDKIDQKPGPAEALDIVQAIGNALHFVHNRDIVHRDIKPENILFQKHGVLKITDFGVAKTLDRDMNLTMDGTALGSPYYLSPEQAEGKELDGRSDIYSLGVILFEMLAGHQPYEGDSQIEVLFGHLNKPIPPLPDKHRHFQGLIEKMMAKKADDRFSSAREMLDYINALREREPAANRSRPGNPDRRARSRAATPPRQKPKNATPRARPWLISIAALILIGSLVGLLWPSSSSKNTPPETTEQTDTNTALPSTDDEIPTHSVQSAESAVLTAPEDATPPEALANILPTATTTEPDLTEDTEAQPPPADETVVDPEYTDLPPEYTNPPVEDAAPTVGKQTALASNEDSSDTVQTDAMPAPSTPDTTEPPEPPAAPPEPHADQSAANPADADNAIDPVAALLTQAQEALRKYRLTSPKNASAYYYYKQALKLEPNNRKARNGIRSIASRYATLAKKALKKGHEDKAKTFVKRGLRLNPANKTLLAVQQQLNELAAARQAPPPSPEPEPVAAQAPPPPKPKPTNNGLQLLDSLE